MSHLHILSEAQIEAINGGFLDTATNLAFNPQANTLVAVPVATGGVGLLGFATGGVAGVLAGQSNFSVIRQRARA